MPWFLVDDDFPTHEGVLATSLAARGLWATAGAWASKRLTDVVPAHVLAAFGSTPELVSELTTARMLKRVRGGYRIEQKGLCKIPTQEQVESDRKNKTARQARWRERKRRVDAPVDAPDRLHVDAVDNSKQDRERRNGRPETQSRRNVDASTAPSTWYPDPDPGSLADLSDPVTGPNTRASPDTTIDLIMKEVHAATGHHITPEWAAGVQALLTEGRALANPAAYIRQAIRNEPNPRTRFLPIY